MYEKIKMNIQGFGGSKRRKISELCIPGEYCLPLVAGEVGKVITAGVGTSTSWEPVGSGGNVTLQEAYDVSAAPQITGDLNVDGTLTCSEMDASQISMDAPVNATLSIRRGGSFKWRMQNASSLGDSLVFENAGSQDCVVLDQNKNVLLTADLTVNETVNCSELSIDDTVDTSILLRRGGTLQWYVENRAGYGDNLVFENVNIDEPVTMQLTQYGQVIFGDENPYTFPKRIGTVGQALVSDGFANLDFKTPLPGRYVQASVAQIVTIQNTTVETSITPTGAGQLSIDAAADSSGNDTYRFTFQGLLYTEQKNEPAIVRVRDSGGNILFTHTMELDDIKSDLPGDLFTYEMTLSRFENLGSDWLRTFGTITYTQDGNTVRRHQAGQSLAITAAQLDLDVTWQFQSNPDTFASVYSLIFERVF
jgi:hypothetical protein